MKIQGIIANYKNYGGQRRKEDIKYIVIHYTSNKGDTAVGNGKYFQRDLRAEGKNVASAHYFVDDNTIVQSVYDNYVAYSVGGGKWNNSGGWLYGKAKNLNTLNIELCGDKTGKASEKTIRNALKLVRQKMAEYNIPAENVIRHYDVNGKPCPLYWVSDQLWKEEFIMRLPEEKYKTGSHKTLTDCYLRSHPMAVTAYKVKYKGLSLSLKRKCKADNEGYAVFKKKRAFSLVSEATDNRGNIWGRIKSGYYLPLFYNGKERIY